MSALSIGLADACGERLVVTQPPANDRFSDRRSGGSDPLPPVAGPPWASVVQRKEPADAAGRRSGQRHLADTTHFTLAIQAISPRAHTQAPRERDGNPASPAVDGGPSQAMRTPDAGQSLKFY